MIGLLLLLVSIAFALPPSGTGAFSVSSNRKNGFVRNGPAALAKAYRKYGWTLPDNRPATHINIAQVGPQTGSVPAIPQPYHSEYLSRVTIGGQSLDLNLDTGSSDLWVFSSFLSPAVIGNHTAYNPNKSSTFAPMPNQNWAIRYGDGSGATGIVGSDTVNIGGATVTSQAIEMATAVSTSFQSDANSDGLVGLAFSSINNVRPTPQKTFFDNIRSSLRRPLFAADLREDGSGAYHFGSAPLGTYKPPIMRVNVNNSQGYWQFASRQITIGGVVTPRPHASPAVADTGTSLLLVDDEVIVAWYSAIPGAGYSSYYGGFVFPCAADIPSFGLTIGGPIAGNRTVTIPPSLLSYATLDDGYCYGAIQSNGGFPLQIYGDILFRAAYVVFYREGLPRGPQLGIADKA